MTLRRLGSDFASSLPRGTKSFRPDPLLGVSTAIVLICCSLAVPPDLAFRRIPNSITGVGFTLLLAVHAAAGTLLSGSVLLPVLFIGLPLGVLSLLRPEGFGMGDTKLCTVVALGLGWNGLAPLGLGFGLAAVSGLLTRLKGASGAVPLAPFIAAGVLAASAHV